MTEGPGPHIIEVGRGDNRKMEEENLWEQKRVTMLRTLRYGGKRL